MAHADNLQSASGVAGSAAGSAPTTPPSNHGSGARAVLIIVVVTVFGLLAGGVGLAVFRHRKRGMMMAGDDNEDDVEYSRLMKSTRSDE